MKLNLKYEDFNIFLDENKNVILDSQQSLQDYEFLKKIFLNEKLMKQFTLYCGKTPNPEEFQKIIEIFFYEKKTNIKSGLQKIFNSKMEFIGISGLIPSKEKFLGRRMFDLCLYMLEEFQSTGIGLFIADDLIRQAEDDCFLLSSSTNPVIKKWATRRNFHFLKSEIKSYNGLEMLVNYYVLYKKNKNLQIDVKDDEIEINYSDFNLDAFCTKNFLSKSV